MGWPESATGLKSLPAHPRCCFGLLLLLYWFYWVTLGQGWQALMKEIDGLIAWSHYRVIEWLCTYDQTVSADVACKPRAWSRVGGT